MAVFSTNQNRQFYVATSYNDSTVPSTGKPIDDASVAAGAIEAKVKDNELYFLSKNLKTGEVIKSDRINLKNLDYAKVVAAADMAQPLTKYKVVLASAINSGNPITGQDYVLRINFFQWIGTSQYDQYIKDAAVHVTAAMTADKKEFYKAMVEALNLAFSREVGASKTANPYLAFSAGTAGSEDGIYIEEKKQSWSLGTESQQRVMFEVQPTTVFDGSDDVIWGNVSDLTASNSNKLTNSTKIADMEYFCMGERGDQYRNMGWPNVITTQYCVDPTKTYDVIELHFAFTDEGVNSYRSEKDIIIACPSDNSDAAVIAVGKAIQTNASITLAKSATAGTWTWT